MCFFLFLRTKNTPQKILTNKILKQKHKTSTLEQKLLHWSKAKAFKAETKKFYNRAKQFVFFVVFFLFLKK